MKRVVCCGCLVFLILQLVFIATKDRLDPPWPFSANENEIISIKGEVYKIEQKETHQMLYLKSNTVRILVYDSTFFATYIGNTIQVKGAISPFSKARNPGNFNEKFYYNKQKIMGKMWANEISLLDPDTKKFQNLLYQIRASSKEILETALGKEKGQIISAMILGTRGSPSEEKELYQKLGIGHIFAISGLHIGLLGTGLYELLRKRGLSFWGAGTPAVLFIASYVLFTGSPISALRGGIMFAVKMGGVISGRVYDPLTGLSIAACCIIFSRPLYLLDGGTWLSFLAILGIVFLKPLLLERSKTYKRLKEGLGMAFAVQIFIVPFLLYLFFEFPLYGMLLNILVVPTMSVLVVFGFLGLALSWGGPFWGTLILNVCKWILEGYLFLGKYMIKWPYARVVWGKPFLWQIGLYYTLITAVLCAAYKKKIRKGMLVLGCLLPVLLFLKLPSNEMRITMLDVGQGDAFFIAGPKGESVLIDGGSSDVKNVGKYCIEPFLKSKGIACLDYVFVSHGDKDHINGIQELIERRELGIEVENLVLPEREFWDEPLYELAHKAKERGTKVCVMSEMKEVKMESFTISYLAPTQSYKGQVGNESSMVLELKYEAFDVLFTGDLEGVEEERLGAYFKKIKRTYDVLKVAHHGSKNSTSADFLKSLQPKLALISAGKENAYGHPHLDTLNKIKDQGTSIYNTKEQGPIELIFKKNHIKVTLFNQ